MRYVIDYYYDDVKAEEDQAPALHSTKDIRSISMEVRPAMDSAGSILDRAKMLFRDVPKESESQLLPSEEQQLQQQQQESAAPETGNAAAGDAAPMWEEGIAPEKVDVQAIFQKVKSRCGKAKYDLENCDSPNACAEASVAMTACMGGIICPAEARAFAANQNPETFFALQAKLQKFEDVARKISAAE